MAYQITGTIDGEAVAFITVGPTSEQEARETFAGTHPHVAVVSVAPVVVNESQAVVEADAAKLTEIPSSVEE